MQLPPGALARRQTDDTLVKALARAFRRKRMLESGDFATIVELAEREGIAPKVVKQIETPCSPEPIMRPYPFSRRLER
jgi:hypothetical protein